MGASADNGHGPWAGGPPGWGELSSQDWGERGRNRKRGYCSWVVFFGGVGPKEIKEHKRTQSSRLWAVWLGGGGQGGGGHLFCGIHRQASISASSACTKAAPGRPEAGTPPVCSVHSLLSQGSTAT